MENGEAGEKQSLHKTVEHVTEYVATTREGNRAGSILRILGQGSEENILPNSWSCRAIYTGMKVEEG